MLLNTLIKASKCPLTFCVLLAIVSGSARATDTARVSDTEVIAQVLEFKGKVEINRTEMTEIAVNMSLTASDTLTLERDEFVTLILLDGSLRKITGPASISLNPTQNQREGSLLARLSSALIHLLFSRYEEPEEGYLVVRDPKKARSQPVRAPTLLFPPAGSYLVAPPKELSWQPMEGVFSYSVSLFNSDNLVWRKKTNRSHVDLPLKDGLIQPGDSYIWVVDAHIGEESLRSRQALFSVLDESSVGELKNRLREIDDSVADSRLRHLLRARLYRSLNLMVDCYNEIETMLASFPTNDAALVMRAQLLEEMGFETEAVQAYKALSGF